jgi:hypothetical protein
MNQWYAYKNMGGRVYTETEKQEHEGERKAHWSPRWPNNDIRKKNYRKVTMKLEKIAGMKSCMRNEKSLTSMSRGRGMEGNTNAQSSNTVPAIITLAGSLRGGGAKPYVDGLQTLRHQHPFG